MTGKLPKTAPWDDIEAPHFSNYPTNLFSLLSTHYDFNVHESVSQLCKKSKCAAAPLPFYRNKSFRVHLVWAWLHALAPDEMRASLRNLDQLWMDAATTNVEEPKTMDLLAARATQYERFINNLNFVAARPQLHYVHLLLPHQPFEMLPNGYVYAGLWGQFMDWKRNIWLDQTPHVHQAHFQHILQARYVDHVIGQLIDKLKSNGAFDSTVIVVTSDHGIQFQPNRGPKAVNDSSYANIVGVPLLIKSAHQMSGANHSTHTQSVDILPTLLGQIGLGFEPSAFDGRNVLMANPEPLYERVFVCGPDAHVFPVDLKPELLAEIKRRDLALGASGSHGMSFSPKAQWIGETLSDLGVTKESPYVLTLHKLVDPARNFAPLYLSGGLPRGEPSKLENKLFVATLNGIVASAMLTGETAWGDGVIAMMLNPEFLRLGENTVSLFATDIEATDRPVFLKLKMKDQDTHRVFETLIFDYADPRNASKR